MLSIENAVSHIYSTIRTLEPRRLGLADLLGLVLAEDIVAAEDLPSFANSAMDGYAVAADDTAGASGESPRVLKVLEDIPAGHWPSATLAPGCAMRIMTGAPLPEGADAVVRVEWTQRGENGVVLIKQAVTAGQEVRPAGEDVRRGETVLRQGTLLRPAEIAMLAAVGRPEALVFPRPVVAILTTGTELVEPGQPLPPGHLRNSNRYSLAAQVTAAGGLVGTVLHVPDEPGAVERALRECSQADVIVTSGGVSVGDFDLVKEALARVGQIHFWKVAIRPGKPLVFGEIAGKPLFGLPGNPVSSMVAFEVFVRPALDQIRGLPPRPRLQGRLAAAVCHKPDRRTYLRARVVAAAGGLAIYPARAQGSGQITSFLRANALVVIPAGCEGLPAGAWAEVIPLWESLSVDGACAAEGERGGPPVISVVGHKNAGKTTLLEALVRALTARGYRVGTIKHDAHDFQIDHEGKDSWRHAQAGAVAVAIASAARCAVIKQVEVEPTLADLVHHLGDVDIVLTEGYKQGPAPKIEVQRNGSEPLCRPEELLAVVGEASVRAGVAQFRPDETERLADLIQERFLDSEDRVCGQISL